MKHFVGKIDKYIIYSVDGDNVRKTMSSEFSGGGHNLIYDFIPDDEIWVEEKISRSEMNIMFIRMLVEKCIIGSTKFPYSEITAISDIIENAMRTEIIWKC